MALFHALAILTAAALSVAVVVAATAHRPIRAENTTTAGPAVMRDPPSWCPTECTCVLTSVSIVCDWTKLSGVPSTYFAKLVANNPGTPTGGIWKSIAIDASGDVFTLPWFTFPLLFYTLKLVSRSLNSSKVSRSCVHAFMRLVRNLVS